MDAWDDGLRRAVHALIPRVEGRPVVNIGVEEGGVYICQRISSLHTNEDSFVGQCEWATPADVRPDELTDEMTISCAHVRLGPGWWLDTYFNWYFVYAPELVARSLAGDHSWAKSLLRAERRGPHVDAPDPGLSHRLLPKPGQRWLETEEVVNRLRGEFAFFAASPHESPGSSGETPIDGSAVSERQRTYSVVASDDRAGESTAYVNFDVRPGQEIRVAYRDEAHKAAADVLVQRCARLLDYDIQGR